MNMIWPNQALERTATRLSPLFAWLTPFSFEPAPFRVAVADLGLVRRIELEVRRSTLIVAMGIFSIFAASGNQPDAPLPEITSAGNQGWHDLTFSIRRVEKLSDGSQSLEVRGVYRGHEVGLLVVLGPSSPEASFNQEVPFTAYKGMISYRSLGPASDSLLHIIDKLYRTGLHPKAMRAEAKFTGISLEGRPDQLDKGLVKIKTFYESDAEDRYAELFTDIDVRHRVLHINEKDETYRPAVVRALSTE